LYRTIGKDIVNAVLVGFIISLSVSPEAPVWLPVLGSAVAIFVAKYQFLVLAGYGSFFSPTVLGILVCALYPENKNAFVEGIRGAVYPEEGILNVFIGNTEGALGTVSALLIILAAIYLMYRRALSVKTVMASVFVMVALSITFVPQWATFTDNMIYQLIGGGFLFFVVFVLSDRIASPLTEIGKMIYGALFAALVFLLRFYTEIPACEAISAVVMNLFALIIDIFTRPSPFGGVIRKVK
jgi:electron transport complex protein RnfD